MSECAYAKSDMTPCVIRDGDVCWADDGHGNPICVGCERGPSTLGVPSPAGWNSTDDWHAPRGATAAAPPGLDWQPIETCPKTDDDGWAWSRGEDAILGWGRPGGFGFIRWVPDTYAKKPKPFWSWGCGRGRAYERANQPTHWVRIRKPETVNEA
jgi:hypothetical protein